jgi:uncharacterized protein YbjT (DUF2867 family)
MSLADIDLSDTEFWDQAARGAAGRLRHAAHRRAPSFFAEPRHPSPSGGPGYYALDRHADVVAASRNPEVFSSGRGCHVDP